ncbi:MAG: hypothetical protein OXF01_19560 [Gemmatimonadetes bacterium]|nr:hypothetical protein [Gemmatimonadota bacterium]
MSRIGSVVRRQRTLGRQGEGPGEFNRAESIAMLPDGRLVGRCSG